ncbi:phospholipase A [Pedomonas mirosovicensis]|uniref:phospholipase A n=1 Tax=Pedomonas mirosovicensis TaxID=2908641 RepID=UPI0021696A6D|nr:phospholipase A [Pedomonas mirosovicensis]MCH8683900.1 phospholipase A [Pedomonas mirosovicensis]
MRPRWLPVPSAKPETGNAYIGNLSAYAPIYAAYGPGTNTEIRLQFSFKYQLFGNPGAVGPGHSLLNGIHFGYTQRMFWDWSANSSPFRNIDFMPELFYLIPAQQVADGLSLGGQFGIRHASNGRDGADSRSINTLYVQPVATLPVGDDYSLSIGPLVEVYVGSLKDNPDIKRYRGNTGLLVEVGDDDGLRLSTNTRFSFQSGRASINAELSYPFDRIIDTSLNLYLFGQAFTGYGENLLDYNRRDTRFRIGFAIVR